MFKSIKDISINEVKKIQVKRKYTDLHPALNVGHYAKIRNEFIKYMGTNNAITEDEFDSFIGQKTKHGKVWRKRNADIFEKSKDGLIRLTKKGTRINMGINESETVIKFDNEDDVATVSNMLLNVSDNEDDWHIEGTDIFTDKSDILDSIKRIAKENKIKIK